jgi:hypothetical protein
LKKLILILMVIWMLLISLTQRSTTYTQQVLTYIVMQHEKDIQAVKIQHQKLRKTPPKEEDGDTSTPQNLYSY